MAKYRAHAAVTVSAWTDIEADSLEEAKEIAEERELAHLNIHSLYPSEDECWHFDNDGLPLDITVEEG